MRVLLISILVFVQLLCSPCISNEVPNRIMGYKIGTFFVSFWNRSLVGLQSASKKGYIKHRDSLEIYIPKHEKKSGFLKGGKNQRSDNVEFTKLLGQSKILISHSQRERLKKLPNISTISPGYDMWNIGSWKSQVYFFEFYKIVSEIAQRLIPDVLQSMDYKPIVKLPIIHYRLADVPFCRHFSHHIHYYKFYEWALKKIQLQGIDCKKLIVLTSKYHRTAVLQKQLNDLYLEDFVSFLHNKGYEVEVHSDGSELEDFAKMVFAPALITSGSSYSFAAGLANRGFVVFPYTINEDTFRLTQKELTNNKLGNNSIFSTIPPLLHSEAGDYSNIQTIFSLLRKGSSIENLNE